MKLKFLMVLCISCLLFMYACNNSNNNNNAEQTTNYKSKNTDSFNLAFDSVLTAYDSLKNAFINWDTTNADKAATMLSKLVVAVPYNDLNDDATVVKATGIAQNTSDAVQTLLQQDSIASKRRMFYTVSESLYNLIKTVGYDKAIIYHKKCPMAFQGEHEGWWVSEQRKIDNPYVGKYDPKYKNAMMECGTIEDSVNNMH